MRLSAAFATDDQDLDACLLMIDNGSLMIIGDLIGNSPRERHGWLAYK